MTTRDKTKVLKLRRDLQPGSSAPDGHVELWGEYVAVHRAAGELYESDPLPANAGVTFEAFIDKIHSLEERMASKAWETPRRKTSPDGPTGAHASHGTLAGVVPGGSSFEQMFGSARASDLGDFESMEEFLNLVHSGLHDPRLVQASFSGKTGGGGGWLMPGGFAATLVDKSLESEIVRPRAMIEPMDTRTKMIAGLDSLDNSAGSLFGGFDAQWLEEGGTATKRTAKVRAIELVARSLALFSHATNEILQDAGSLGAMLVNAIAQANAWHLDYAFLNGDGKGKPLGILNDPAKIVQDKEVGQAAGTVVYENLTKMLARLHPACLRNAVWVASPTCIPELMNLTIDIGTAGAHVPAMRETDAGFTVLTRPVVFTEKVPALGSESDISLMDISQYTVGMRREMTLERSNAVGWTENETDFRSIVRVDGQGRWPDVFTPRNGDTMSWVVTLAERS